MLKFNLAMHIYIPNTECSTVQNDSTLSGISQLANSLKLWATHKHNVTHSALTDLSHILHEYQSELPLDSRTLLKTPLTKGRCVTTHIKHLENGEYCHFGLSNSLIKFLKQLPDCKVNRFNISFNVDDLPLFHSSTLQFWPILELIKNVVNCKPFIIGIFCGQSKPLPLCAFLHDFLKKVGVLIENGLTVANVCFAINVHSFVCHAQAKAYLKCTKSHTGYSACDKCMDKQYKLLQIYNILSNRNNNVWLVCKQFRSQESLYTYPLDSRELNIFIINDLMQCCITVPLNDIIAKCFVFPLDKSDSKFVSFPLLNSL